MPTLGQAFAAHVPPVSQTVLPKQKKTAPTTVWCVGTYQVVSSRPPPSERRASPNGGQPVVIILAFVAAASYFCIYICPPRGKPAKLSGNIAGTLFEEARCCFGWQREKPAKLSGN